MLSAKSGTHGGSGYQAFLGTGEGDEGLNGRNGQDAVFFVDRIVALEHSLAAIQHQLSTLASMAGPLGLAGQDGYMGRDRIDGLDGTNGYIDLGGVDGQGGRDGRDGQDAVFPDDRFVALEHSFAALVAGLRQPCVTAAALHEVEERIQLLLSYLASLAGRDCTDGNRGPGGFDGRDGTNGYIGRAGCEIVQEM